MNQLSTLPQPQIFDFNDAPVRIVTIDGDPWFVAADVCKALGLSNPTKVLQRLDDDEQALTYIQGNPNQVNVVSESGLFSLVLGSEKPQAKDFKRWVTHDVLPAIRKTGSYAVQPQTRLSRLEMMVVQAQAMVEHERELALHTEQISALEQGQVEIRAELEARNEHFSVLGYCRLKGLRAPTLTEASQIGKRCVALSNERGFEINRANDPRFGWINIYHQSILAEVLNA